VAVIAKTAFRAVLRLITSARQIESQTFASPHQALYSEPGFYVWFSLYDCELYNLPFGMALIGLTKILGSPLDIEACPIISAFAFHP
jgi:hypothetical protein